GGVGREGDPYEQHADAVADKVVRGESAEAALDASPGGGGAAMGAIQRKSSGVEAMPVIDVESDLPPMGVKPMPVVDVDNDLPPMGVETLPVIDIYSDLEAVESEETESTLLRDLEQELSEKAHEKRLQDLEQRRVRVQKSLDSAVAREDTREQNAYRIELQKIATKAKQLNDEAIASGARDDLQVLRDPGKGPIAVHKVIKKHRPDVTLEETEMAVSYRTGRGGESSHSEKSEVKDGAQITETHDRTKTVLNDTETRTKQYADGVDTFTDTEETTTNYRHGKREKKESSSSETADGRFKREQSTTTSHQAGQSEWSADQTTQTGDNVTKRNKKTSVTYGRGGVGAQRTDSTFEGQVDQDGNETGVTNTTTREMSGTFKDGEGTVAGDVKHERARKHSKHVETKAYGGAGFSVSVKVKKVTEPDAIYYLLVTSVTLKVSAGVAAEGDTARGEDKANGKVTASGGGTVSVSLSASQRLDEGGMTSYLNMLEQASSGTSNGGRRELAVIATAASSGPDAAYSLYKGAKTAMGSADAAKGLQDGESVQLDGNVAVEGSAGLEGSRGKASAGFKGTAGVSSNRKVLIKREGDKIIVTLYVTHGYKVGGEGSAGYGPASATVGHERERSSGRTVQIVLSESDPDFQKKYEALTGCVTQDDLSKTLQEQNFSDEELKSDSQNATETDTTKMGLGLGPAGFDIAGGNEWSDEVVIEDGQLKRKIRGANNRSGGVSLDLKKISASGGWLAEQLLGDSKLAEDPIAMVGCWFDGGGCIDTNHTAPPSVRLTGGPGLMWELLDAGLGTLNPCGMHE
ncbi:MAG: hypothetical protein AAFS10_00120, partial [Myxococcota bacterium]